MSGPVKPCKYRVNFKAEGLTPEYWCKLYEWTCRTICQTGNFWNCRFYRPDQCYIVAVPVHQKGMLHMAEERKFFNTMQQIADHLHVSRMTLHRWAKTVSLNSRPRTRIFHMTLDDVNRWFKQVQKEVFHHVM